MIIANAREALFVAAERQIPDHSAVFDSTKVANNSGYQIKATAIDNEGATNVASVMITVTNCLNNPVSAMDVPIAIPDNDPGVGRRLRRECGVRADVIPWRASDFTEFRNTPNTLAYSVASEGVLLHER